MMILVQFEQTQNPDMMRIFPEADQLPSPRGPVGPTLSNGRRLLGALLAIQGIATVVIESDAITVTRSDAADSWVSLWPQIDRVISTVAS
jgi:hypothetical protein